MSKRLLHTPEGVRDIYGKENAQKLALEALLQETIHGYGYEDIQTPTFEFFDVFSKEVGTIPSKDLYKFFDKDGNTLALRPDFTPSIARCAAKYFMEEQVPIRLCYLGNAYVNTSHLQGKLTETTEIGVECINDDSVYADAEMIALVVEALQNTGLEQFHVSIGQIEFFKGLCAEAGLDEETELELRDFISAKNYFGAEDLLNNKGIEGELKAHLLEVSELFGGREALAKARSFANNERSVKALERLEELYEVLKMYGCEKYVSFDLGMVSKYNYYTGIIFKGYTYGVGDAIVKGGRYNNLLKQFGKEAPAIGFMVVVDDLLEALQRQKIQINTKEPKTQLYYTQANYKDVLEEAKKLRKEGKSVELLPEK